MDMTTVTRLLSSQCTKQSRWEFVNFVLEEHGEFKGRAAQSVLARRRQLHELLSHTAQESLRTDLINEAVQLDQWLDQHTEQELADMLATIEDQEADYWAERLGREAAVDLMSQGKVSKEVMSRAVLLSEEGYRKFAETCGSVSYVISTTSKEVEMAQGYATMPEGMPR
jgi:hypothetical protein